eukprot:s1474_g5.t1
MFGHRDRGQDIAIAAWAEPRGSTAVLLRAARVLRSQGRLVLLCGQPELLATAVVQGPWKTLGAWPMTRWGRRGAQRNAKAQVEQLICLEKLEDAAERPEAGGFTGTAGAFHFGGAGDHRQRSGCSNRWQGQKRCSESGCADQPWQHWRPDGPDGPRWHSTGVEARD